MSLYEPKLFHSQENLMLKSFGFILQRLDDISWKNWVYFDSSEPLSLKSLCLTLNPDVSELGTDGFTPVEVERLNMDEFLSIQNLMSIQDNLKARKRDIVPEDLFVAALYYFNNDAFIPDSLLVDQEKRD